jgi:peptide deformylase
MQLVKYPDPRLRQTARPVKRADAELLEAIPRMFEVMYRARGIGLAGPQVGLDRRIIVANLTGNPENRDQERVFLDPEIVDRSGEKREDEGCLSFPGMSVVLVRAEKVEVRYLDLEGREVRREAEGLEAKLFQHEIDHLDGILLVDKMTPADKKQWASLLKDLEKEYQSKARRTRSSRSKAAL